MFQNPEQVLLIASVILFLSIFAGKAGYRFGLPALLLFLGVGMLFGSDVGICCVAKWEMPVLRFLRGQAHQW